MRNSKFAVSAAVAVSLMLGIGAASAADLPAKVYTKAPAIVAAAYDWSGFYLGIDGGWGSSRKCWDRNTGLGGTFLAAEGCHDATGGVVGGQVGYRWQSSAWVFGVEAQGDWANLTGSNVSLIVPFALINGVPIPLLATSNRSRIDAFGLFAGQIGYAWDKALLYVKGGAAVTSDKYTGFTAATGVTFDSANETRWGGVAGVGLEYAFARSWSAAVEYDHMFMGTRTLDFYSTIVPGLFSREDRIRQDVDLVTVRVNYRFGGPVVARY
jgi:outer membrane immunogenic protein